MSTDIIYTISLMLLPNMQCRWDIFKMSNGVSPETHFQGKTFPWSLALAGHHIWYSYSVYPWHIHQIAKQSIITWYYNPNWSFHNQAMTLAIEFNKNCDSIYYRNWLAQLWVSYKQHYYAHYNFMLTIITWIPTYHVSLLTQSHTSQQWLVVVSTS